MDFLEKMLDFQIMGMDLTQFSQALDEERRKIQVFQRELPLCLELVTRAIESCRQHLSGTTTENLHIEESENDQSPNHVLEEFIPMKRDSILSSHFHDAENDQSLNHVSDQIDSGRSDWLKSAQLWNQSPDPPLEKDMSEKMSVVEVKKNGGAFQPFKKEKALLKTNNTSPPSETTTTSSTAETASGIGGMKKREEKEKESQRKQRRCWSSELHRRFLQALQQLGGPHVATPKQIRELMKVDGLTNDEVKSHLQKYRLHTRRPSSTMRNNGASASTPPPQFVVVGSVWVPPPQSEYQSTSASGEASGVTIRNGIYAPVAKPVQKMSDRSEDGKASHSAGVVHSNSPATSSSTHTTTTSPSSV